MEVRFRRRPELGMHPACVLLHKTSENELLKYPTTSCCSLNIFATWKKGMDELRVGSPFPPPSPPPELQN